MNTIYLLLDEKKDFACIKIGFTTNFKKRMHDYKGYTPFTECISIQHTQERSKRKIETLYHEELVKMGYKFIRDTEWMKIEYTDDLYQQVKAKGLAVFKASQGRKTYMMVE